MSEILIKGMKMPKSCITGKLPYYEYCPCFGGCSKASSKTERPSDCPLVEVPPHGDLVDRDFIIENGLSLREAPTIIEASTEEKE